MEFLATFALTLLDHGELNMVGDTETVFEAYQNA